MIPPISAGMCRRTIAPIAQALRLGRDEIAAIVRNGISVIAVAGARENDPYREVDHALAASA